MNYGSLTDVMKIIAKVNDTGITFINTEKDTKITYNKFYEKSLCYLHKLQANGLSKGDELVFQLENIEKFIYTFWGCILGGIIPVPISMISKNEENYFRLLKVWSILKKPHLITDNDSVMKLKNCDSEKENKIIQEINENTIVIKNIMNDNKAGVIHESKLDDIAYIQFSSGSTGEPKGVFLTHKNVLSNAYSMMEKTVEPLKDSMLSWLPLTHNMGLIGAHILPIVAQINQYVMPTGLFIKNPNLWIKKASDYRVTVLGCPNFAYKYFLSNMDLNYLGNLNLSSIKCILNGAEPISEELCKKFVDVLNPYGLGKNVMIPGYGLAEAGLIVTLMPLDEEIKTVTIDRNKLETGKKIKFVNKNDECGITFVDVGYPVKNMEIKIVDDKNKKMDQNVIGNIHIRGNNVSTGYYGDVKYKDIYLEEGWLNTGDIGFIKNGRLIITGRAKDIIFVNGQNYYAHDLERIAKNTPELGVNVVVATSLYNENLHEDEVILFVLYLNSIEKFASLSTDIKHYVNSKVAINIKHVIPIANIPKTISGKVQRFKLIEQYLNGEFDCCIREINSYKEKMNFSKKIEKPSSILEESLLDIWCQVLQVNNIQISDNFFDLGGHSINATKLAEKIQKELNIKINIKDIFSKPTVKELAKYIQKLENNTYSEIKQVRKENFYSVSSSQKRIYIAQQSNLESINYNMSAVYEVNEEFNRVKVENIFNELINRHESLRTSFELIDGKVVQIIHDKIDFNVQYYEVFDEKVDGIIKEFIKPFDLRKVPLFRVGIIKARKKYMLMVDMHHIIADGVSTKILIREFNELMKGNKLSELKIQYKDYANWHNDYLKTDEIKKQGEFWLEKLKDFNYTKLVKESDKSYKSIAGSSKKLEIDSELTTRINNYCKKNMVTKFILLITVFKIVIAMEINQRDISIGIPVAGRRHNDLDNIIGIFLNILVIRSKLEDDMKFIDYLKVVENEVLEAQDNQDYPYEKLYAMMREKYGFKGEGLFSIMINYMPYYLHGNIYDSMNLKPYNFDEIECKYDINLFVNELETSILLKLDFKKDYFKTETIDRILKNMIDVLNLVLEKDDVLIKNINTNSNYNMNEYLQDFDDEFDNEEFFI